MQAPHKTLLDKTIKLWKVFERNLKVVHENNLTDGASLSLGMHPSNVSPVVRRPTKPLTLPKLMIHDTIIAAVPRRIYANGSINVESLG